MKNITRHQGKLEIVERLPSSINGNPRYLLRVDGWTCRTPVDSGLGYCITNYNGKDVEATIGSHYGVATLATVKTL
jgi:hypothetical protein